MGRRWRIKLQHANRERERAEIEVQESRKAMGEMRERTDQAVAAHEAAAAKAAAERDAAESKAQQLALDLEWKTYAAEQVEEVMRGQEKRLRHTRANKSSHPPVCWISWSISKSRNYAENSALMVPRA